MAERICRYCDDLECIRFWHMYRQALRDETATKGKRRENLVVGLVFAVLAYLIAGRMPFWLWFPTILVLGVQLGVMDHLRERGD
jgi:hypothetical protein